MDAALELIAPAKVNLYLAVGGLREDGYHDVTTVLHALALHDTLTLTPAPSFTFACSHDLGLSVDQNLAVRAARAMSERYARPLKVAIRLTKRIPAGAGLGGASADAAAVVLGLARAWGLETDDPTITEVARGLGADVPFFLEGGAALFVGRGDVLETRLPALDAPVVLAMPAKPVSTAAAYAALDAAPRPPAPPVGPLLDALGAGCITDVAARLHNDMTAAAVGLAPDVARALDLLGTQPGVLGALVAGSGSCTFGICADDASARRAAERARTAGLWSAVTRLASDGCRARPV